MAWNNRNVFYYSSEAKSPESAWGQGGFPLRAVREILFRASVPGSNDSLQPAAFLGLWFSHSDLCLRLPLVFFLGFCLHMAISL